MVDDFLKDLNSVSKASEEELRETWTGTQGEMSVVISGEEMTHEAILIKFGHDPEKVRIVGVLEETHWMMYNIWQHRYRFKTQRKNVDGEWESEDGPAWPVIQPAPAYKVKPIKATPKTTKWKTAIAAGDTQIGFRALSDESLEAFHDESAINVALQLIAVENPEQVVFTGDMIDLPSQGTFAQEAGFARMTQPAIDRTSLLLAQTRAVCDGKIVIVEGNHDKRMKKYVEANSVAAFGLKIANKPSSWPVMSLQNLLNIDEFNVQYIDAYPAGTWWIAEGLRVIHGTKANSAGSTASQYANKTPHISTVFGHTHRLEIQSKTTFDRAGKIRTMNINPGCLCDVSGKVPSVNGSVGTDGRAAQAFEDWQQGVAVIKYRDSGEFFVDLVQIDEGRTVYQGQEFSASPR